MYDDNYSKSNESEWFGGMVVGGALLAAVVFGYGYSEQLNDAEMKKVKQVISQYDYLDDKINQTQTTLESSRLYDDMSKVYRSAQLGKTFDTAMTNWRGHSKVVRDLRTTVKENPWWSASDTLEAAEKLKKDMRAISGTLGKPKAELEKLKREIDSLIRHNSVASTLGSLEEKWKALQAKADRAKAKHKDSAKKIDNMMSRYVRDFAQLRKYEAFITASLAQKYNMNYNQFKRTKKAFEDLAKRVSTNLLNNGNSLDSLDTSYSKMLTDMKAEFKIMFGYSTWDDYAEWDNTKNARTGWVVIPDESHYYALTDARDLVAKCSRSWGSNKCQKFVGIADKYLRINIARSGDTTTEFWVEGTSAKFFHKYKVERDGKTTETGWQPVTEKFYWDNHDNLGMALETKPMGSFTEETIKEATPPGLAYVGNPNYGQYDAGGNWIFFGMWGNSYGGYGYDHDDRRHYNDHRRKRGSAVYAGGSGYYGRGNGFGTYGNRTFAKGTTMGRGSRSFGANGQARGAGKGGK